MAPMPTAHSAAAALQEPLPAPASISTAHPAGAATTLHQPPPAQDIFQIVSLKLLSNGEGVADVALEVLSQHQIREVLASLEAELCQMDSEYNTILRQKQQDVMTEENKENLSTREARVVDAINAKGMQVQRLRFYLINHRQQ
eukprot:gene5094-6198_t